MVRVAQRSNLLHDPDIEVYHLANLSIVHLPFLLEELSKLRGLATKIAAGGVGINRDYEHLLIAHETAKTALYHFEEDIAASFAESEEVKNLLANKWEQSRINITNYIDQAEQLLDRQVSAEAKNINFFALGEEVINETEGIYALTAPRLKSIVQARASSLLTELYAYSFIGIVFIAAAFLLCLAIFNELKRNFKRVTGLLKSIEDGNCENNITVQGKTEFSSILNSIAAMQTGLKNSMQETRELAETNGRIKQALDSVNANVLVTDSDLKVIYLNNMAEKMFSYAEADFQKEISGFNKTKIIGMCLADLVRPPSESRQKLIAMETMTKCHVKFGSRAFHVIASPVFSDSKKVVGSVVQWADRTAELKVEDDLQQLVNAALAGDLSRRISLDGKLGFHKRLSESINSLVDVSGAVIEDISRVFSAMAKGDLDTRIDREYKGTYNRLKQDVHTTIDQLTNVVRSIQKTSNSVYEASTNISKGNNQLAKHTSSQASDLEETSTAMAELTSSIQGNVDEVRHADQLAIEARREAETGGEAVNKVVTAMGKIDEASRSVSKITGVINEIAFQINLLALNAAVEAARAGEQGRGFAVVASEVRNLASRSSTAADEIKELIEDTVSRVQNGAQLAAESGDTLDKIIERIHEVNTVVTNLSESFQEQAEGVTQVSQSVDNVNKRTQENSVLVEETSEATDVMAGQSDELKKLVGFFQIQEEHKEETQKDSDFQSGDWCVSLA